jgi:hypothetical protein
MYRQRSGRVNNAGLGMFLKTQSEIAHSKCPIAAQPPNGLAVEEDKEKI